MNKNIQLHQRKGMTLIEMMIVIIILSILILVAYPVYQEYVNKAKFVEVTLEVLPVKQKAELYLQTHGNFTDFPRDFRVKSDFIDSRSITVSSSKTKDDTVTIYVSAVREFGENGTYILRGIGIDGDIKWNTAGKCKFAGLCE